MANIEVWAVSEEAERGFWPLDRDDGGAGTIGRSLALIEIDGEQLRTRIRSVIAEFDDLLTEREEKKGGFSIDEIELGLTISAKGGIQLITKLEGGAEASIKVRLRRAASA
jgi:hypothetical protein